MTALATVPPGEVLMRVIAAIASLVFDIVIIYTPPPPPPHGDAPPPDIGSIHGPGPKPPGPPGLRG
jgi:hypothetical protein